MNRAPVRAYRSITAALALALVAACSGRDNGGVAGNGGAGGTMGIDTGGTDGGGTGGSVCGVPSTFAWSSTGALLSPQSDATHNLASIKDPSIVYFNGKWH